MDEGMKNKKGQTTTFILLGLLIVFILVIGLIVIGSISTHTNDALSQNITIGQVNLKTISDDTFGKLNTMILNNADWWGIATIFGMVFGLFLTSYFARNTFPKIGIIIDIFMIFAAFIFSLYLSVIYKQLVVALSSAGENFAEVYLPNTSYFILNLPIFVAVIGIIMMILFHSSIPRKSEETTQISNIAST